MSFGKDPSMLKSVGSFRQQSERLTKRPQRSGGGGNAGARYRDRYRPSELAPDTVRLVPGNYKVEIVEEDGRGGYQVVAIEMPNFKVREHFYARNKKTAICSGGPLAEIKGRRDPCIGCDQFWAGMRKDQNGKSMRGPMGMSDSYVFNVLHYANYHEVEQRDGQGAIRANPNTGAAYTEWVVCNATYGAPCPACQAGKKTEFGRMLHWSLGYGHYKTLLSAEEQIGRSCASCAGVNTIDWEAWLCSNPECQDSVIEKATTSLSPEEIKKTVYDQVKCPKCGHFGFLMEYIECRGCDAPRRASLFDVDMNVMRIKQGRGESQTTVLQVSQWSAPRPIDQNVKDKVKPFPLDKLFAPTPIDKQAEMFGLPMPSGDKPADVQAPPGDAARPYGGGDMYKP